MSSETNSWHDYWAGRKGRFAYDVVARFYRDHLIRPSLARALARYAKPGDALLHAGCGSGQVDRGLDSTYRITALDLSSLALDLYREANGKRSRLIAGSIFDFPFRGSSFDAVYNLGVMEHFEHEDVVRALRELHRVLKPRGYAVLFWPPEMGASVLFFKGLHFAASKVAGREVRFHPEEITRVRSRGHATRMLASAGFDLVAYEFGLHDAFTHAVVVGRRRSGIASRTG